MTLGPSLRSKSKSTEGIEPTQSDLESDVVPTQLNELHTLHSDNASYQAPLSN